MRILALIPVVWSFVAMPTLCRAGILVECCTLGIPGHGKSHDATDKCPNDCPCDTGDDGESSHPRDCDSCTESCNVVSTHSKQTDADDFAVMLFARIAAGQVLGDAFLSHKYRSRNLNATRLAEHVPIPASDRPLLI